MESSNISSKHGGYGHYSGEAGDHSLKSHDPKGKDKDYSSKGKDKESKLPVSAIGRGALPSDSPALAGKISALPNQTPQIFINRDNKIVIIKPAPNITKLSLQGGGAKGIAYGEFAKALNEHLINLEGSFIENLSDISGASAGGMMSFLLAGGVPIDEIITYMSSVDMTTELDGKDKLKELNIEAGFFGWYSGGNVTKILKEMVEKEANNFITSIDLNKRLEECELTLSKEKIDKDKIAGFKINAENKFKDGVTLGDLAILHALNPKQFKRLHLVGTERDSYNIHYFNSSTSFDMPAHLAMRISMALPFVLSGVLYNGKDFWDGGLVSNVPVEAFEKAGVDSTPGDILALILKNEGENTAALKSLHPDEQREIPKESSEEAWEPTLHQADIYTRFKATDSWDMDKIYHLGTNVAVADHGELTTTSFSASKEVIDDALKKSRAAAEAFCEARKNQAIALEFEQPSDAINSLTDKEKIALLSEAEEQIAAAERGVTMAKAELSAKKALDEQSTKLLKNTFDAIEKSGTKGTPESREALETTNKFIKDTEKAYRDAENEYRKLDDDLSQMRKVFDLLRDWLDNTRR